MPPIVTCHPHPPTYIIPGTRGRHHDMMMIMVESEVMAMPGGLILRSMDIWSFLSTSRVKSEAEAFIYNSKSRPEISVHQ
ncbi:hypothetical protein N7449_004536 [Penicillium cf. viridicatum]|uniref:Uncharacterized protein n=1 Tax=Penicillium cf. viridicatum TaxID=2972119 RepID=A0A9W9SY62_9EURO|nr:hypothetical protein N7449_004536 [Penicillium cf. viridicatum]